MTTELLIPIDTLWNAVGTGACAAVIDGRTDEDFAADPRLIPGAVRRPGLEAAAWAAGYAGGAAVVYCERGLKISQGAAAWLRAEGASGQALAGGFQAWRAAGLPLVPADRLPPRGTDGRTQWVAAAAPGVEAIACPWLVRRFVDRAAVFLFVEAAEVTAVAERFGAAALGPGGISFDGLLRDLGLETDALARLAAIVGGAAPEAAGLQAAAAGLHALHGNEPVGLEMGLTLCDAYYRWCCDAGKGALK